MKTEIEIIGLRELSNSEIRLINGGGLTWRWIGTVLGYLTDVIDFVNEFPQNAIIAGVTIQTEIETTIDVYNRR
jgi:hypothetical protein